MLNTVLVPCPTYLGNYNYMLNTVLVLCPTYLGNYNYMFITVLDQLFSQSAIDPGIK
jgi:hypothetical protein